MKQFSKKCIIVFAIFGFLFSIFMIFYTSVKIKPPPILFPPPIPPYTHYVAGYGLIEAESENIDVGTPFPEIVDKVYIKNGDYVKKGTPLYKLNTQTREAELERLIKLKETKQKALEDQKKQYSFYQRLENKNAVSESMYYDQFYKLQIAQKELNEVEAQINVEKTNIKRSTITAPIDGKVLDMNLREGENAQTNPFQKTYLLLFGSIKKYRIKVSIDETESWRVYPNAKAIAYVRGNSSIEIPLEFINIDPYIEPKVNFIGRIDEKIDTRVLQVIYQFEKGDLPVYIGQLVDVYIEALPSDYKYEKKDSSNN